ncbi:MAG: hypothetical protein ABIZ81_09935 [Opitutaceae bacterium]
MIASVFNWHGVGSRVAPFTPLFAVILFALTLAALTRPVVEPDRGAAPGPVPVAQRAIPLTSLLLFPLFVLPGVEARLHP